MHSVLVVTKTKKNVSHSIKLLKISVSKISVSLVQKLENSWLCQGKQIKMILNLFNNNECSGDHLKIHRDGRNMELQLAKFDSNTIFGILPKIRLSNCMYMYMYKLCLTQQQFKHLEKWLAKFDVKLRQHNLCWFLGQLPFHFQYVFEF